MPKSFPQITNEWGGEIAFLSSQSDVLEFLGGPQIADWGGMCFALVMMWLKGDSLKKAPNKGVKNKVEAIKLQNKMEESWEGLITAVKYSRDYLTNRTYWYYTEEMRTFNKWLGPATYLKTDPQNKREGLHILVLYFNKGPAHAIGVVRVSSGVMLLYDPNHGASALSSEKFENFLAHFVYELYSDVKGYAIISFAS